MSISPETFATFLGARTPAGCLEWQRSKNNKGYGTVHYKGKTVTAHRLVAFFSGLVEDPIAPKDKKGSGFILHQCDNPACCNVEHFKVGTYSANQKEAYARGGKAQPRGQTHANATITDETARAIRAKYVRGVTRQVDLAREFGLSQVGVSQIILNRKYKI